MGVIFIQKFMIWQRLLCAHILSLIMHLHTGKMYFGAVPTVHVSIFLTKKQIKNIKKQHPQSDLKNSTSLHNVLLMLELHLKQGHM